MVLIISEVKCLTYILPSLISIYTFAYLIYHSSHVIISKWHDPVTCWRFQNFTWRRNMLGTTAPEWFKDNIWLKLHRRSHCHNSPPSQLSGVFSNKDSGSLLLQRNTRCQTSANSGAFFRGKWNDLPLSALSGNKWWDLNIADNLLGPSLLLWSLFWWLVAIIDPRTKP